MLRTWWLPGLACLWLAAVSPVSATEAIFNIKDYGATGRKSDDARPAIQKAIDAAGTAGGGTVYMAPGEYTSGTLHLRSHVRMLIDSGATLFASLDGKAFEQGRAALRRRRRQHHHRGARHGGWPGDLHMAGQRQFRRCLNPREHAAGRSFGQNPGQALDAGVSSGLSNRTDVPAPDPAAAL
jgi:hypothetical protein